MAADARLPITVVIPAYRRPDMVERALRSVQAQRPAVPAEVIVVDDCSGDETGARAAELGARVITHERNQGRGGSRNTGLAAARHDWVALLDSDDEWLPSHLATVWAAREGFVLVGSAALSIGGAMSDHRVTGWAGRRSSVLAQPPDVALPENKLPTSAVLLRRDVALKVGGFRDLQRAEDLDLWLRMLGRGKGLAIPRVTVLYHVHSGQISHAPEPMWSAHRDVLDAYVACDWHSPALRRRHEGVVAWDAARAMFANSGFTPDAAIALTRGIASLQGLFGVAQLLAGRSRRRRLAARLAPDGGPSLAVLPGAVAPANLPATALDLRTRGTAAAMLALARRRPAQAIVRGRTNALLVRALGVTPLRTVHR